MYWVISTDLVQAYGYLSENYYNKNTYIAVTDQQIFIEPDMEKNN